MILQPWNQLPLATGRGHIAQEDSTHLHNWQLLLTPSKGRRVQLSPTPFMNNVGGVPLAIIYTHLLLAAAAAPQETVADSQQEDYELNIGRSW